MTNFASNFNEEIAPAQNPDQNFGEEGGNRTLKPPKKSEMLSEPKINPEATGQPNLPKKLAKIESGETIPDPLDMSAPQPMTVVPVADSPDDDDEPPVSSPLQSFITKRKRNLISYVYIAVAILLILLLIFGIRSYISGQQAARNQCSITNYTDYATDEKYVECMASAVAREVTSRDTHAFCLSSSSVKSQLKPDNSGWTEWGENEFVLQQNVCQNFYSWLKSDRQHLSNDQGIALQVIIHEAIHVSGEHNESNTECKSMQVYEKTVASLGISSNEATRFISYYKSNYNPRLSEAYRVNNWSACES
jgi:hypothetical protein